MCWNCAQKKMPHLIAAPALASAVESLYAAFQGYPLRSTTNPCSCCHNPDDERRLHMKPLRRLTAEDLYLFSLDALLVWGDPDDFRHFLPRIFELVVSSDDYGFVDREIELSKLYHAEWHTWPESERHAVHHFLFALWRAVLETAPGDDPYGADELESWLCAITQVEADLSPYFGEWLESSSAAANWNLAAAITRAGLSSATSGHGNAFWQGHDDQLRQLSEWLHSRQVRKKLEAAIETFVEEPFSEDLYSALLMLG